ncbi:hypothetical protein D2A34_23860 [Clostridium chromiireducens]|uniref:Uncharacterized protein n=1 Tax=Clostridium chromiireducens TaxID=225345 RepID=A0A399ILH3_9CLOT|nr:ABC-three component system middle component 1 [Clostridium chromiireducens]RII32262.1 hypothetical protein D2A34_23860 [Clostridium chromiireducens]
MLNEIMDKCFKNRYREYRLNDNKFITSYYLIDDTYILTFYVIDENGIPIAEMEGEIIATIQSVKGEDRFRKYDVYLILLDLEKYFIDPKEKNEIEKDKFSCRKIFINGNEKDLEQELNNKFNLGKEINEFESDLSNEELELINFINEDIANYDIDKSTDINLKSIEDLCSYIEILKLDAKKLSASIERELIRLERKENED